MLCFFCLCPVSLPEYIKKAYKFKEVAAVCEVPQCQLQLITALRWVCCNYSFLTLLLIPAEVSSHSAWCTQKYQRSFSGLRRTFFVTVHSFKK